MNQTKGTGTGRFLLHLNFPLKNTKCFSKNLSDEACAVWNNLPESIKHDPSLEKFREQYRKQVSYENNENVTKSALEKNENLTSISGINNNFKKKPQIGNDLK